MAPTDPGRREFKRSVPIKTNAEVSNRPRESYIYKAQDSVQAQSKVCGAHLSEAVREDENHVKKEG